MNNTESMQPQSGEKVASQAEWDEFAKSADAYKGRGELPVGLPPEQRLGQTALINGQPVSHELPAGVTIKGVKAGEAADLEAELRRFDLEPVSVTRPAEQKS